MSSTISELSEDVEDVVGGMSTNAKTLGNDTNSAKNNMSFRIILVGLKG